MVGSKIFPLFLCLLGLLPNATSQVLASVKRHTDCDLWAREHNECVNNPRFMWTACLGSCLQFARNNHQSCDKWAQEGECTNNPAFMHVNCPRSCAMGMVWSPWVRSKFDLEPLVLDPTLGREAVAAPEDVFQAAELMRERLVKVFEGLFPVVRGLSPNAPTEYLGLLGLTEAVLYSLRLLEVLFRQAGSADQIDLHVRKTGRILDTLRAGFSSDRLLRELPVWVAELNQSALLAAGALRDLRHSLALQESDPSGRVDSSYAFDRAVAFSRITDYYYPPSQDISALAASPSLTLTLNNGMFLPLLGLGTWQLGGDACYEAVLSALRNGYRLLDSAEAYGNEAEVGRALRQAVEEGSVQRDEVVLASKASDEAHMGYEGTKDLVASQLARLQVDHIDLYFLHSPLGDKKKQRETWRALEDLVDEGKLRALGVSNFEAADLADLLAEARIPPAVVQNKLDIYHVGKQVDQRGDRILQLAKEKGIVVQAYSPFSAFPFVMQPAADPIVAYVAARKAREWGQPVSPAQVLLKWTAQHGFAALPRSQDPARQRENLAALALPPLAAEDMKLLDTIQLLISSPMSVPVLPEEGKQEEAQKEAGETPAVEERAEHEL